MQSLLLMYGVDGIIEDLKEPVPLELFILKRLHLDLILVLQVPEPNLLPVNVALYYFLFVDDFLLGQQVLLVLLDLLLQLLIRLDQRFSLPLDLVQQSLVFVLLFV